MKKHRLYLLYLLIDKELLYDFDIKYIKPLREMLPNEDDDSVRFTETIYAVSDNIKDINDFLSFRNKKKFRLEKVNFDTKDELNKAKLEYTHILIKEDDISFKDKSVMILTTNNEMDIVSEYLDAYQSDMFNIVESDYRGFKQEYIKALDILAYTYFHSVLSSEEEDSIELAENCMSYGVSPEGYVNSTKFGYKFLDFLAFTNGILNYVIK